MAGTCVGTAAGVLVGVLSRGVLARGFASARPPLCGTAPAAATTIITTTVAGTTTGPGTVTGTCTVVVCPSAWRIYPPHGSLYHATTTATATATASLGTVITATLWATRGPGAA